MTVLVAVSGGADSVALLRGLVELRLPGAGRLVVTHFNHKLRGTDADADQTFVARLASDFGLETAIGSAETDLAAEHGGEGLEGAARQARYEFFCQSAHHSGARFVATAHTADDQVETVLFNLLRGTGLAGLGGIPRVRELTTGIALVRPLLSATRNDVLEYLGELGQSYQDDATNQSLEFQRNRIRHELLPLLEEKFNPQVRTALRRTGQVAAEADAFLRSHADDLLEKAMRSVPGGFEIDAAALQSAPPILARYALMRAWRGQNWPLQDMGFERWEQLLFLAARTCNSDNLPTQKVFPGGIVAGRSKWTLKMVRPVESHSTARPAQSNENQ